MKFRGTLLETALACEGIVGARDGGQTQGELASAAGAHNGGRP
jgi:hypothetical protein